MAHKPLTDALGLGIGLALLAFLMIGLMLLIVTLMGKD